MDTLSSNLTQSEAEQTLIKRVNKNKSYYTTEEYNNLTDFQNELSLISLNINSLNKYCEEFSIFIECLKKKPDIIILQETRANIKNVLNMHFTEYNHLFKEPIENRCGGIALLVKKEIKFNHITNLEISIKNIENIVIEIFIDKCKYLISGIYKHPGIKTKELLNYLKWQLDNISSNYTYILAGDINIDYKSYSSNVEVLNYFNKLRSNSVYQLIDVPTRITKTSNTIIDHIYMKVPILTEIKTGILTHIISDHLSTFIKINTHINEMKSKNRPLIRIVGKRNVENFKTNVCHITQNFIFDSTKSSDEHWDFFVDKISSAYENAFPIKQISINKFKSKSWMTPGLKKSSQRKEKLYKKWLNNKTLYNENTYKTYKNAFNKAVKTAKQNYYVTMLEKDKTNKMMWDQIRTITGNDKKETKIDELITFQNEKLTSPYEIADEINKFFASIGEKMGSNIIADGENRFQNYMPPKINKSLLLKPITENEIARIINKFHDKTSSGDDLISQKLLKQVKTELIPIVKKLINLSIHEKKYPDRLKIAKVIPIYKSGCKKDSGNYRPISLLSVFNKIFECKIQNDLVDFIEENNILYSKQFGFRKYHSTIDALINTHDYVVENIRKKNKIIGIFIDLKKAFDSIDNEILVKKLEYYGINGPYNDLIKSYLKNRKIYTLINETKSKKMPIKYGVPQGSVLGPLLFSLYINDIKKLANDYEINLFADDTSLFCVAKTYDDLERKANLALTECSNWLKSNRLTININKTHYIDFSKSKERNILLKLGASIINQERETKYLGIILQNDLKWESQIRNVIQSVTKQIPIYYILRTFVPKNKLLQIYKALTFSKINYGIELYGRKDTSWLKQLQKAQNRLLKILFGKRIRYSTNKIHKENKIIKVKDLAKLRLCLICHKVIHNKKLTNISHRDMTRTQHIHDRNLRNNTNLNLTTNHFNTYNKITEQASIEWNSLNSNMKKIESRKKFKKILENHLLQEYD